MTALPVMLTDKERAQCRKDVVTENRADVDFVREALGESDAWHKALLSGDAIELERQINQAVLDYCEACDMFGEAERDLKISKEFNGRNYLTA